MTSEGDGGYPPTHDVIKKTGHESSPKPYIIDGTDSFLSSNGTWIPKSVFGVEKTGPFTETTPSVAVNFITGVAEYITRGQDPRGKYSVHFVVS